MPNYYNISGTKDGKDIRPYPQEVYVGKGELLQCRGDTENKREKDYKYHELALAGVTQLVGASSCNQKVMGLISS